MRINSVSQRGIALAILSLVSATVTLRSSTHAADEKERLVDLPPFDQLLLDANNKHAVLKVEPLELPNRKVPAQPSGNLTIRLLSDPTRQMELPWDSIQKVLLFEDFLLQEATRLTKEGKFDEAFEYYERLLREYPDLPGVKDAANDYLRRNAVQLQQSGESERALSVLSALYERQPSAPGLGPAVDDVCGTLIERYLREKNYAAARAVLDLWHKKFATLDSAKSAAWEQRFAAAATRQVADARAFAAAQDYVAARRAIGRARDIWPDNRDADALLAEMQRQNPTVSVGVFAAAPQMPVRRIDDWAAIRASRLLEPTITELVGIGTEGGVYQSPLGEWVSDENGLRLSLKLKFKPTDSSSTQSLAPSAATIARFLLNLANPANSSYHPEIAELVAGISVKGNDSIHLDLKRPHVRPEALLQLPLTENSVSEEAVEVDRLVTPSGWVAAESSATSRTFTAIGAQRSPGSPQTIVELRMQSDQIALEALLTGEIDVLDRVPPWLLSRLRDERDIRIGSYALPTVHVLALEPSKPLSQEREFRRALCFALQRDRILKQLIAGGADIPGFRSLSGPFPAGQSASDPLSYGYNSQIEPRPFEPRLATVLASVAWAKIPDPTGKGAAEPTPIPTLTLAHPPDPVARQACAAIKLQLDTVGIPVQLVEITADELAAGKVDYDLRYAELAVWEPIADVHALFGAQGIARALCSLSFKSAVRELDRATNWKDVRAKFAEIHDIAHHDLPLIPLWQTVNFFAYRAGVQGIGESPVTLYQHIDKWRMGIDDSMATLQAKP